MITYGKYDESDRRTYSIELEECHENDVPDMLDMFDVGQEVSFAELEAMGWRGKLAHRAEIKSLFHPCYHGLSFPDFVKPYNWGFPRIGKTFGTKIMAQSGSAKAVLEKHDFHAYPIFRKGGEEWVWMNLAKLEDTGFKTVPLSCEITPCCLRGSASANFTPAICKRIIMKEFRFIDLFAGIGGLRKAFEAEGGHCVFTLEWGRFANETYKANFRDNRY